jgi:YidC/Oxa1 family membrane protein insertase
MAKPLDKDSLIGFVLIGVILIGWSWWMSPSQEDIAKQKIQRDSIAAVDAAQQKMQRDSFNLAQKLADAPALRDSLSRTSDSVSAIERQNKLGIFASAGSGSEEVYRIENDHFELNISSKGGRPMSLRLKDYLTYNQTPLYLFEEKTSEFFLRFMKDNRMVNTGELYFVPQSKIPVLSGNDTGALVMRLNTDDPSKYIDFIYGLKGDAYTVDFKIEVNGMDDLLADNQNRLLLRWALSSIDKEKGFDIQNQKTSVFYKYSGEDRDYLGESGSRDEALEANLDWISFKQQFFSVGMLSENGFIGSGGSLKSVQREPKSGYIKDMATEVYLPMDVQTRTSGFRMFFGPNQYYVLGDQGLDFEKQIDLGWGIFGWVSKWLIIPIFFGLSQLNLNYGIIILLLTLIIKLLLSPLTYKNYVSSAKQKVLKPEIEELNAKFKDADPMKKQQEVMQLYSKAGVNPFAGCVPMLLQMPILYAMFMFFPSSIELRGQRFLWAEDLSTYDSVISWDTDIWLVSSFYGNHVSLFVVLMCISMFFYTKYNMDATAMGGGGSSMQAQQIKIMSYIMPFFLLIFLNKFSAGLSYYYLCANVTTMLQAWVIKKYFIDEAAIHAKVQENRQKPKKKGGFQAKLEELTKQQKELRAGKK